MKEPTAERRAPRYKPTLIDSYHGHLRTRRTQDPAVPVLQLFREIKELGYTGSLNLLYRHITQGRAECDKPVTTQELSEACPEMPELARLTGEFAQLLTPAEGNDAELTDWITTVRAADLTDWITTVRAADLPHLHSFASGLELDRAAVDAGLTLPFHNGRTEGVDTRTKRITRQMHGRAGFPCSATASSSSDHYTALPPITGQGRSFWQTPAVPSARVMGGSTNCCWTPSMTSSTMASKAEYGERRKCMLVFNDVQDSSSFEVSASLDGERLTGDDILRLELVRSRRALAYLKQKLGRNAMLELLRDDLDATAVRVAEWVRASAGQWATGAVTLELPGLRAGQFEHWFMDTIRQDDEPTLRAAHPDHFLNHPRPNAPAEVIENVGEDELPWHILLTFHGTETEFPTPWDPGFTHCFGVRITDRDGTPIGSAMHELRDGATGMIAKLTIHLPAAVPPHLVRGHLRHFSIEFRNWAEMAYARSLKGS